MITHADKSKEATCRRLADAISGVPADVAIAALRDMLQLCVALMAAGDQHEAADRDQRPEQPHP